MSPQPPPCGLPRPRPPVAESKCGSWCSLLYNKSGAGRFSTDTNPPSRGSRGDEPSGPWKITGGALNLRSEVRKERRRDLDLETMLSGHFEMASLIRRDWHQGPLEGQVHCMWLAAVTPTRSGCEFVGGKRARPELLSPSLQASRFTILSYVL